MSRELILKNARLVLGEEIIHGSLAIRDGKIVDLGPGVVSANGALDFEGDYLLPGLVELHTDHLEKHLAPRPGVIWPNPLAALKAHDAQMISSGITTVLDAVFVGEEHDAGTRRALLELSVGAISQGRELDCLRADHLLHLRCEISEGCLMDLFRPHLDSPCLKLVSLMDHTPGQRQFSNPAQYRRYYEKQGWSDEDYEKMAARLMQSHLSHAERNWNEVTAMCRERGLPLASHDDTTAGHVDRAADDGMALSEFPTTREAAERARRRGLGIISGAPNLVRGGSHSGNVSARELAAEGLVDVLSSDYVPMSLMQAVFYLHREMNCDLPMAVGLASRNPARMVGLSDRGELAPEKRADLIRVGINDGEPHIISVWQRGGQVF